MYKILLIGKGYWGKICEQKLKNYEVRILDSKNYNTIHSLDINTFKLIIIATPNNTHLNILQDIENLNYKNKVFCEKPLCEYYNKSFEYLKSSKLHIYISDVWLYNINYLKLKNISNIYILEFETNNFTKGNIFFDLIYHDIYMIMDLFKRYNINNLNIINNKKLIIYFEIKNVKVKLTYNRNINKNKNKMVYVYDSNKKIIKSISFNYNKLQPDALSAMFNKILKCNYDEYINLCKFNNNFALHTLKLITNIQI